MIGQGYCFFLAILPARHYKSRQPKRPPDSQRPSARTADREKERHPTPYPETSTAHPPRYPTARKFFSFFQFQPTPTLTLRLIHSTKANLTTKNSVLSVYPTSVRLANNPCF